MAVLTGVVGAAVAALCMAMRRETSHERRRRSACSASALLLVLIFARVPIAVALAASGLLGYAALDGWAHGAEDVRAACPISWRAPIPCR